MIETAGMRKGGMVGMPVERTFRDAPTGKGSIADECLKRLATAQERLNNLSLSLRDKLEPICCDECSSPVDSEPNQLSYPPLFNEMRELTRRLQETADRLESIMDRCVL